MNQWPDGWNDDDRSRYGQGSASPRPERTRAMPHVQRGGVQQGQAPVPPQRHGLDGQPGYSQGQVYQGGQPPAGPPGGPGGPGGPATPPPARPARNWRRRITVGLLTLVVVLLVTAVGTYFWADSKLNREVDLSKVEDRPEAGKGTNYLIVGSDSRKGLSDEDKERLHTGDAGGDTRRTDTMMILHVGENGSTMVSLPRDSYVTIPPFTGSETGNRYPATQNKLNAAFSQDGPGLLVRTVEYNTGLKIDHYAEIGFAGFANIVDALGGVEMCLDKPIKDKNSGADFEAGCQTLDGAASLAFVRQRYQEAEGDLGRTKNQQRFLAELASQAATPSTVLNPFTLYPTMGAGLDALIVDKEMSLWNLAEMFWSMKDVNGGDGTRMNIPIAGNISTPQGASLKWDMPKVKKLMEQLRNDEKVTVEG